MFWRKKRSESDLAEEIRSHLALEADERRASGESLADSEFSARRAFGNATSLQEKLYEQRRWMVWEHFSRDLRHAFRLFYRYPGFSAVVVLTLGLGIGANTAIFGVIDAVLLRPLPYREPQNLMMLWSETPAHELRRASLQNFGDWKVRSRSLEDLTAFVGQTFLLGNNDGPPDRLRSARVQSNFFPLLGVAPAIGRTFTDEEQMRAEPVVLISDTLWHRRFGGSLSALGSDLIMDGRKSRVIGVMPPSFQYPFADTQVWELATAHRYWTTRDRTMPRSSAIWYALGRLRSGVSVEDAQADMSSIARQLDAEYPENKDFPDIRIVPLHAQTTGPAKRSLEVLFGSVFLMLLIACINAANLLLARGAARKNEFSVRRALGASQTRLASILLAESLVLSVASGVLGLLLAASVLKALIAFGPQEIPRLAEAHIDGRIMFFTLSLSIFTAIVSALWPVFQTSTAVGKSRTWANVANRNVRNVLVIGEVSIALILLIGAGLLVRSFVLLQNVDPGFRPENLLIARVDLHVGRTADQQTAYFREATERVQRLPGVRSAGAISGFLRSDPETSVFIEGRDPQHPGPCEDAISGAYFETAGIPLKRGRFFSVEDRATSPRVAIINESMARTYWAAEDPIGKRFRFAANRPWMTVVGVTGDMHRQGLERGVVPQAFLPEAQETDDMMDILVRTDSNPQLAIAAVREEIQSIDKTVAKFDVSLVERQFVEQTSERRFQTWLFGLFSLVALLMSAIGIYGLMHYFVAQRTHELGLRMALGARSGNVLALVLRQGLALASAGLAIGIVLALAVTRLLASLLFGITFTDPLTYVGTAAILFAVAGLACWLPARRATRIDPVLALRRE